MTPWLITVINPKGFFLVYFLFYFVFNVYLFLRDREWAGEEQRERETQNPKQVPGSELSAQSPSWGSNPQTVRSWPEPKSDLNRLSHPGAPNLFVCLFIIFERERERGGEGQREGETQSHIGSALTEPRSGAQTHKPWDRDLSQDQESDTQPTEPPRCPNSKF